MSSSRRRASSPRTQRSSSRERGWSSSRTSSGGGSPRPIPVSRPARSASAPPISSGWGRPPTTTRSSRCSGTSASAITSRKGRSNWRGGSSPVSFRFPPTACGSPCTRMTTRRIRSGGTWWGSPPRGSSAWGRTTIGGGRWATAARVARTRRSSGTGASPPADPTVGRPATAEGSPRSGTSCSCSTTREPMGRCASLAKRTSTPGWASSG